MTFPIYVIHYTGNKKRKKFIDLQFEHEGIEKYEYIEEYDKEKVTYGHYRKYFNVTESEFKIRKPRYFPWGLHNLKEEEVSLCLKQKLALERFLKTGEPYCLILEDDVILADNFLMKLNDYLSSIPQDWGIAFIGQAVDKRIPKEELQAQKYWYLKEDYPFDRCADSYLITKKTATKIISFLNTRGFLLPYDHELSGILGMYKDTIKTYWLEPPLVSQGSQCGIFESFQDIHSQYFNPEFKNIRSDTNQLIFQI